MEIVNKADSSVGYSGAVSVTLSTKGHKKPLVLKNSGTSHLFDVISRALAGYSIKGLTPRFIDIQRPVVVGAYESVLIAPVPVTGIVYGIAAHSDDGNGHLLMNATITFQDKQPLLNTTEDLRLVLLDSEQHSLAIITEVKSLWDSITESTDAYIEWSLTFKNEI